MPVIHRKQDAARLAARELPTIEEQIDALWDAIEAMATPRAPREDARRGAGRARPGDRRSREIPRCA